MIDKLTLSNCPGKDKQIHNKPIYLPLRGMHFLNFFQNQKVIEIFKTVNLEAYLREQ